MNSHELEFVVVVEVVEVDLGDINIADVDFGDFDVAEGAEPVDLLVTTT